MIYDIRNFYIVAALEWSYIGNYNDGTAAVVATLHTHDTESCIITGTAVVVAT